ncbi:Receptor-interacting serine/threonine-protein kinase 3 [Gryganskiella cystojenkinii]|nr:Receptor-interacting serine/threonine-protein kinase 3 [Gryganskiella cystojenkinii]
MTVAVMPVNQDILTVLQYNTPQIPFEEISRLVYNTHIPGRIGKVHIGRWQEYDIELREPTSSTQDPAAIEKEIRLLHRLKNSPQIIHLHGYTIEPETLSPLLVFQHTEHGTLHSYLLNFHPHLTWPDRYNLAMDIVLGLRYLHQRGASRHRHLHSASVLIDTNGSALLSDFGNSRDSEVLSSREHLCRMAYLAPERLSKNGTRYSVECDIYSLGVVLWEISSGRPPFEEIIKAQVTQAGSLTSLAQNIVAGRREKTVPETDPAYEAIFQACWSANPQDRPTLDWVINSLSVLLKQPANAVMRQLEELSIVEEEPFMPVYAGKLQQPSPPRTPTHGFSRNMSIKVARSPSIDNDGSSSSGSPQFRSRELLMSPREPDYPPPPPPIPPPIPPVSQRRKLSTAPSFGPSMRSMSVSSGSSTSSGGGGGGGGIPMIPSRDVRRISTMNSSIHSGELRFERPMSPIGPPPSSSSSMSSGRRRGPQSIWEACQEGNAVLAEWHVLTSGANPDGLVSLPLYSMLAEVAPIHVACFYQPETLMDVLKTLQRNGATMQLLTTLTHQSALHIVLEFATSYNLALEAAKYLINDCKLSVNDPDNRGLTAFHKYIKNQNLSGIPSVAGSELYTLLRERGEANLSLESHHEGNALGMTARYLRADLMKLFLLTDLTCSEPRSLHYALSVVEAPLSDSRSSKSAQDLCRNVLAEWKGEKGETKRMHMAERILQHQGLSASSAPGSSTASPSLASSASGTFPAVVPAKIKKQGGLLGLGKSSKGSKEEPNPAVPALPSKVATEVDAAKKILQSTAVKQRKLKTLIADSGF